MADSKPWLNSTFYRKLEVFFIAPLGGLSMAAGAYGLMKGDENAKMLPYTSLGIGAYLLVAGLSSIPALRRSYNLQKSENNLENKVDEK
ncbi:hypothetical protein HY772_06075 [Candidatus Woesearchaeota archaeon]|nr:hypothetical protein [Candidatus Woesearchaeota archaeon]